MRGAIPSFSIKHLIPLLAPLLALVGCSASQPPKSAAKTSAAPLFVRPALTGDAAAQPVMLGIDVLEAEGFAAVKGKRLGLLTHPAGVNRQGTSTIEVLRRAAGVKLVALYGVEHGLYNEYIAETKYGDHVDSRTGLTIYSLYNGKSREATAAQLKAIDALVIDLQDIGTRSYTFTSAMKLAMQACFKHGKEVIVLDRPNPLGGLKVDGPLLDAKWTSYVGAFCVPYVHGLTMGELARMAKTLRPPTGIDVPDSVRAKGKLTVIPMRGWTRSMRWSETGLKWVPTSQMIPDFAAVLGYPMLGMCAGDPPRVDTGFRHGIGRGHPFRGLSCKGIKSELLQRELDTANVAGVQYRLVSVPNGGGKPALGLYVEITDFDAWRPTELSFALFRLACKLDPKNPFAPGPGRDFSGFLRHMGSEEFLRALQRDGARIDLDAWLRRWREQALVYQQETKKYWLYR